MNKQNELQDVSLVKVLIEAEITFVESERSKALAQYDALIPTIQGYGKDILSELRAEIESETQRSINFKKGLLLQIEKFKTL